MNLAKPKLRKIYIELSDICQLSCPFCPAPKGVRGIMPLSLFARALESAKHLSKRIALHILGDPCYLPDLSEYLALAGQHGLEIELVTSGLFFHKHEPALLLSPPIYQLSISLESGAQNHIPNYPAKLAPLIAHHYQNPRCFLNLRIQKGTDTSLYEHPSVLGSLLREILPSEILRPDSAHHHPALARALLQNRGSEMDRGEMGRVGEKSNKDRLRALFDEKGRIRLWSRAFLLVRPHFTWAGFAPPNTAIPAASTSAPTTTPAPMPVATPVFAHSVAHGRAKSSGRFCHGLIEQIGILSDGTIVPCCMDTQGVIALGNIRTHSLEKALQSPRAQAIIAGFHRGVAIEPLCQSCGFRG